MTSLDEAMKIGMLTSNERSDKEYCNLHKIAGRGDAFVFVSKKLGLSTISLPVNARTDKGISIGSSAVEVRAAYLDLVDEPWGFSCAKGAPGKSGYQFLFENGKVKGLYLNLFGQDCHS